MTTRSRLLRALTAAAIALATVPMALPAVAGDLDPRVAAVRSELTAGQERIDAATSALASAAERVGALEGDVAAAEALRDAAADAHAEAIGARQIAERKADEAAVEAADRARALDLQTQRVIDVAALRDLQTGDLRALAVEAWKNGGDAAKAVGVVDALLTARDVGGYLGAVERLGLGADRTRDLVEATSALLAEEKDARDDAAQRAAAARQLSRRADQIVEERLEAESLRRAELAVAEEDLTAVVAELDAARGAHEDAVEELAAATEALGVLRASVVGSGDLGGMPGPGMFSWPTDGRATSGFGSRMHPIHQVVRQHTGIDIPGPTGQPILAAAEGTVRTASGRSGYGLTVEIDHGDGYSTLYAHLSAIDVVPGQRVAEAERIGALGNTGQSTGPHLHFEVRLRNVPTDPLAHFRR